MNKIVTVLFLSAFNVVFSQVVKTTPAPSSSSNQPKVIVFKPDSTTDSKGYTPEFRHMIKISPLMFFNGDFPLFYEMRVGNNTSIEVAAGMTSKDHIHEIYDEMNDNNANLFYEYGETTEYQFGRSLRAAFKYWPSKYGALDEGYYFSPEFLYRNYKSTISAEVYDADLEMYQTLAYNRERTVKEFRMLVGWVYYLDDNVFFEYFVGVGLASINNKYFVDNSSQPEFVEDKSRPNYIVGIKLGFSL